MFVSGVKKSDKNASMNNKGFEKFWFKCKSFVTKCQFLRLICFIIISVKVNK